MKTDVGMLPFWQLLSPVINRGAGIHGQLDSHPPIPSHQLPHSSCCAPCRGGFAALPLISRWLRNVFSLPRTRTLSLIRSSAELHLFLSQLIIYWATRLGDSFETHHVHGVFTVSILTPCHLFISAGPIYLPDSMDNVGLGSELMKLSR